MIENTKCIILSFENTKVQVNDVLMHDFKYHLYLENAYKKVELLCLYQSGYLEIDPTPTQLTLLISSNEVDATPEKNPHVPMDLLFGYPGTRLDFIHKLSIKD